MTAGTRNLLLVGLAAVLLVLLAWFGLLSPKRVAIAEATLAAEDAVAQQTVTQGRIRALQDARSRAPDVEALLANAHAVIPTEIAMPSALRQLQDAADGAGVELGSIAPSAPSTDAAMPEIAQVSLSIAAQGSYFQLVDFLRRIEDPRLTSRGMMADFIILGVADYPTLTAEIGLRIFAASGISAGGVAPLPDGGTGDAPATDGVPPADDGVPPADGEAVDAIGVLPTPATSLEGER